MARLHTHPVHARKARPNFFLQRCRNDSGWLNIHVLLLRVLINNEEKYEIG